MAKRSIAELTIYPIKACGGIPVTATMLERRGLRDDRRLMIVTIDGQFVTQREHPRLALVQPQLDNARISLTAPGMSPCVFDLVATGERKDGRHDNRHRVEIWGDRCVGIDQGREVGEWFSRYLQLPCRVVRIADEHPRRVDPEYAVSESDEVSFADGFPLLLVSRASLDDLNQRLDYPVTMRHFRPNVVVEGCEPFEEDRWRRIELGGLQCAVVKPCQRCQVITVDPQTGYAGKEPLLTLSQFRRRANGGVYFGQNVIPIDTGAVAVGDAVTFPTDADAQSSP